MKFAGRSNSTYPSLKTNKLYHQKIILKRKLLSMASSRKLHDLLGFRGKVRVKDDLLGYRYHL